MKNNKLNIVAGSLVTGIVISAAALSAPASNLFSYESLGSGAEVRSTLLEKAMNDHDLHLFEMKCGEESKSDTTKSATKPAAKKGDSKTTDAKCGEGKCGEKKGDAKKTESKTKDAKCGEGKCGVE